MLGDCGRWLPVRLPVGLPGNHHASPRNGAATVTRRPARPAGHARTDQAVLDMIRRRAWRGRLTSRHSIQNFPPKIRSCTCLATLCSVRAIITTPSGGRVREPTAGVGFPTGRGLRIPPLSVKCYTVSGRGADGAPARLHRTPLGPEGRAVRPGSTHAARSVQGA